MADDFSFKARKTIVVPVTEDGKLDVAGMREKTKEKLKDALSSEEALRAVGVIGGDEAAQFDVPQELAIGIATLFHFGLVFLLSLLVKKQHRTEYRQQAELSESEKGKMGQALGQVISKHAGPGIAQYSPEIYAVGTVVEVEKPRIERLIELRSGPVSGNGAASPAPSASVGTAAPVEPDETYSVELSPNSFKVEAEPIESVPIEADYET